MSGVGEERADRISAVIDRFSTLSIQMTELLSDLSQEIREAGEQLDQLRLAVERKRVELKEIEAAAQILAEVVEQRRRQKEELERELQIRRARDEEEYRREAAERKEAFDRSLREREEELKEKEREWVRLTQDLEQLMSRLLTRFEKGLTFGIPDVPGQLDWGVMTAERASLEEEPIFGKDLARDPKTPLRFIPRERE
ncbi:MAG: hypothetical protein GXX84_20370 [Acidobacteria bacterium]|nr:hypothetical protein [Acidobacteriota bacterium]